MHTHTHKYGHTKQRVKKTSFLPFAVRLSLFSFCSIQTYGMFVMRRYGLILRATFNAFDTDTEIFQIHLPLKCKQELPTITAATTARKESHNKFLFAHKYLKRLCLRSLVCSAFFFLVGVVVVADEITLSTLLAPFLLFSVVQLHNSRSLCALTSLLFHMEVETSS